MSTKLTTIEPGKFYHIFNRAIGNDHLFRSRLDYQEWLFNLKEFILPIAELHAFTLLPNHYHLLVKALDTTEHNMFSKELNRIQSIYAKRHNSIYNRKGGLFHRPYGRKPIKDDAQLAWILWYIHRNPLHHQITQNWDTYPYSSFSHYNKPSSDMVTTSFLLNFFGGLANLNKHHQRHAEDFIQHFNNLTGE